MSTHGNGRKPRNQESALNSPELVYTQAGLARMVDRLRGQPLIAVDTESDSLYSYYPKVCLIQITAYADARQPNPHKVVDYLVDPLRLDTLEKFGMLLAEPELEVVMHAAENDILMLQRSFGFHFANLFDTQIAARILGWQRIGLASILEQEFGLVLDKRMQRTNWGKRPLTPQQIAYAQRDTHYLPALRVRQIAELNERKRWEEAQDAFAFLAQLEHEDKPLNERTFWQMKGARKVDRQVTGVLEAVWEWREHEAQRRDRPPFRIALDHVLIQIAQARPADVDSLHDIDGLSAQQIRRYGDQIIAAVRDGATRPLPDLPPSTPLPEYMTDKATQARYDALRNWRTKTARRRGVEGDVVFSNSTLLEIAKRVPRSPEELQEIDEIGPWKAKTYAADVLRLINGG